MTYKILMVFCLLAGAAGDYYLFKQNERTAYDLGRTVAALRH